MSKSKLLILFLLFSFHLILAQENPKALDTVTIKLEAKTFIIKNGNLKVDVANSIYKSISNPIDLLSKLPNIQVSPDKETITLIGKGNPILYIDNQKVTLNELNSLSVDDIKSVEIIKNPSSKYEAEGRAVILITRKFSKKEGFKTIVSENASCQKYFNNYFGINSSVKKNKFEFKANFNYNQIKVWESNGNNFSIPSNEIVSNYLVKAITRRPQFIFGTGVFYKINEDDYLSLNVNVRTQKDIFDITTDTSNQNQSSINFINTLNANDEYRNLSNGFVNYNHKIKSMDAVLFSGFQYSHFNQGIASSIYNDFNSNGLLFDQNRYQKIDVAVFSGRADFEKEFKNKLKLELGALYLQAESDTDFSIQSLNNNTTSTYNYDEQNSAVYSQFSGNIKKASFSIGVRAESTVVKGKFASESNFLVDKNYIKFFPKAMIEIPIDSSNTISFNYAKSISRPNFSTTSQFTAYINPYFVWSNNINLDPSITDEIAISYQYKNKVVRMSYNKISNPVYYATSYDEIQNLLTFQTTNFNKESGFNFEFTLPFKYKFWSTTNTLSCILNTVEDQTSVVNQTKPYLYYYSNHIFKLPKEITIALTGWGLTHRQEGIFNRNALFTTDFAISKTFFKSLDCTISYNDIFRQMKFKEDFTINGISNKLIYYTDANLVSFAFKYSFGKIKNSEYKERTIDENSGRIR